MIIASAKKKENIAEYILYMWQIEDLIRAYQFNIEELEQNIINHFSDASNEIKDEMKYWYNDLIQKMKQQGIQEKGHLDFLKSIIQELEALHQELVHSPKDLKYIELYNWASPNIKELRKKSIHSDAGDIQLCLEGLYGLLLMRLKSKNITEETKEAMSTISNLTGYLSQKYKEKHKENA
jgi:hypothetical protein